MPFAGPMQANASAIDLRAQGRLDDAITAFREGLAQFPDVAVLHQNLAQTLYERGDTPGAIAEHRCVLEIGDNLASHMALYELLQIAGEREQALAHQRRALTITRLFSHVAPKEQRRVLCLCAPGDWQANIPVDFLFDLQTTTVHKLYLLDRNSIAPASLPRYDVIWNIIAESPESMEALALANYLMNGQRKPVLNAPARVIATGRALLAQALAGTGAVVPPLVTAAHAALEAGELRSFAFPVIVRPIGSHAGHGLERVENAADLPAYVSRNPAAQYFVSPFVDYASIDGYYRKYRFVFVDGVPYPVHEAISPNWMIHYYNAPMGEHAWMREEEAAFLADPRAAFDGPRFETLVRIAAAIGLEYFGIDCAIDRDGNVLVFEADAAMLVHTSDPVDLYPYKHQYIPRIYRAVERMIDGRRTADT
jgi:glutathione synthase/RimK-type ligase-like ATP-grasp enzyme